MRTDRMARGLCAMHYQRFMKHGTLDNPPRQKKAIPHGTPQGYNYHGCRCDECSQWRSEYNRQWNAENADRLRHAALMRNFGVTLDWYEETLAAQGGVCLLCKTFRVKRAGAHMDVDHDHFTGQVRGILCNVCNAVVGKVEKRTVEWRDILIYLGWTPPEG